MTVYVIWDELEEDYHYGGGAWGYDIELAEEYDTPEDADRMMEEIDQNHYFHPHDRFHALPKKEAT